MTSDEQTTCPNCEAPGELRSMIGPEMKAVTRMRWLCGSTNLEGKEWPTEMCDYAASLRRELRMLRNQRDTLISERDEARLAVQHLTGVISEMQDEIDEAKQQRNEARAENTSLRRVVEATCIVVDEANRGVDGPGCASDEAVEEMHAAVDEYRKEQQDG